MNILLGVLLGLALIGLVSLWVHFIKYKGRVELFTSEEVRRNREELMGEYQKEIEEKEIHWKSVADAMVKDARESTKRGLIGKISGEAVGRFLTMTEEYLARYDPQDVVALRDAADYLVFVGKAYGNITEVIFQEMKYLGRTDEPLTKVQKSLKGCIEEGRVRWETWIMDKSDGRLYVGEEGEEDWKAHRKTQKRSLRDTFGEVGRLRKEGKDVGFTEFEE